ncbi:preprotein translocase subunit SecG [Candidatus Saccharibacteria bacterium]|nr:preprotein translocase subunit SecG [Candidatus Saccharibacteria bacterium]
MKTFLQISLIVVSILIVVFVLMQNQGSGLGTAFGGETNFYRTKRGAEKFLFYGTIVLGVAFVVCILGLLTIK